MAKIASRLVAFLATLGLILIPALPASAEPVPAPAANASDYATIDITLTNPKDDPFYAGETMYFTVSLVNNTEVARAFGAVETNLTGNVAGCRWQSVAANGGGGTPCTFTHVVTNDDVVTGSFTPQVTFLMRETTGHTSPISETFAPVVGQPITVAEGEPAPDQYGAKTVLATAGDYGFTCHRIPALTTAPNGDILASWDGRPNNCQDAPQANSIIMRRSADGGETWGDVETIAAGRDGVDRYGYSDPSFVVDRETGTIFTFFVKSYDKSFQASELGTDPDDRNVLHAVVVQSDDNGHTWSEPRNITADITGDNPWQSRFAASGEGIQLRYGDYAGRLIQQYTVKDAQTGAYRAVSVFSDDHGATWQVGEPVGTGMDENKSVELSNGDVMLNSRASDATRARKVAISTDGGQTYGDVRVDSTLIDPRNNASIIRAFPDAEMNSPEARILLFSNAGSTSARMNGTLRISYDDGQTWSSSRVFEPGPMSYSTLTALGDGTFGLLYEATNNDITFQKFPLEWIGGVPLTIDAGEQSVHRGTSDVTVSVTNLGTTPVQGVALEPTLPSSWALVGTPASFDVPGGQSVDVMFQVSIPVTQDEASVNIPIELVVGEKAANGSVTVAVELAAGEHNSVAREVALIGSVPEEIVRENAPWTNALDGDLATFWHTPWAGISLPLDVDLAVDAPVNEVSKLVLTNRQDGHNGRINAYEIYAGGTSESLVKVASGALESVATPQEILLDTAGLDAAGLDSSVIRVRGLSSYGDQVDRFVSLAELEVRSLVADDPAKPGNGYGRGNGHGHGNSGPGEPAPCVVLNNAVDCELRPPGRG